MGSEGLRVQWQLFRDLDPLCSPKGRVIPHREESVRRILFKQQEDRIGGVLFSINVLCETLNL